jgi:poly(hydroxyalkanoate) depolymerase family esterase
MNNQFASAMSRATASTRAQNLGEATRIIQEALAGRSMDNEQPSNRVRLPALETGATETKANPGFWQSANQERMRKPLGETLHTLREGRRKFGAFSSLPGMTGAGPAGLNLSGLGGLGMGQTTPHPMPEGAEFQARTFVGTDGTRDYKIYIPSSAADRPRGLIVMLHGCKQNPDDFAAGTKMNAVAEAHGLAVAYPRQSSLDNASSCWNWFNPSDQGRDSGEPAIIAGITRAIITEFGIDTKRVFVAGLSAGGAMAAIMGETYPDLYGAVGIHSGLPYGCANDVMSAFAAMRGDSGIDTRTGTGGASRRVIVFHGSADPIVHPSNADRIIASTANSGETDAVRRNKGISLGGRSYDRTTIEKADGQSVVESWVINGAGHAWSGGHSNGSYTDPQGPDASAEMVRFFLNGIEGSQAG